MLKCLATGDVVDQQGAGCAAEVRLCDGAEGLLAGRVPDLELDLLAVRDGNDAGAEFDADCNVVGGVEAAFAEADGERGFAAAGVADVDDFLGGVLAELCL